MRLDNDAMFPRERLRAYWLAHEYHARADAASRGGGDVRRRLLRNTFRVVENIGRAADGSELKARNLLDAARDAVDRSLIALEALVHARRVPLAFFLRARRHAARLLAWIERLALLPVTSWPEATLSDDDARVWSSDALPTVGERLVSGTLERALAELEVMTVHGTKAADSRASPMTES
jgi:hypothetical protein